MSTKLITPVRRSKSGRPGSAGEEIPLTASMERLPPDPSRCFTSTSGRASYDLRDSWSSSPKSRPLGSTPPTSGRTRNHSAEGPRRRSAAEAASVLSTSIADQPLRESITATYVGQRSSSADGVNSSVSHPLVPPPANSSEEVRLSAASITSSTNPVMSVSLSAGWPAGALLAAANGSDGKEEGSHGSAANGRGQGLPSSGQGDLPEPSLSPIPNQRAGLFSRSGLEDNDGPPATPGSVTSGLDEQDGTFFTALRRSFGDKLQDVADVSSSMNPMQSPDEDAERQWQEYASYGDEETDAEMRSLQLTDYGNPMMTPTDGSVDNSLLNVIQQLYIDEPEELPPSVGDPESAPVTRPSTALSQETPSAPDVDADEEASRTALADTEESTSDQEKRRAELSDYIHEIKNKTFEGGEKLVELPNNYLVMVQDLMRRRRNEYDALKGWMGPRRFDELPIGQLLECQAKAAKEQDAMLTAGLEAIYALDEQLHNTVLEGRMQLMQQYPEAYEQQEKARLEKHAERVEEALRRERQRHLRANRLARVVGATGDAGTSESGWSSTTNGYSDPYLRFFTLKAEEEALVEEILHRGDEDEDNPFDISFDFLKSPEAAAAVRDSASMGPPLVPFDAWRSLPGTPSQLRPRSGTTDAAAGSADNAAASTEGADTSSAAEGPGVGSSFTFPAGLDTKAQLSVINARLEFYMAEHVWDESGQLADFRSILNPPGSANVAVSGVDDDNDTCSVAGSVTSLAHARGDGLPPPLPSPTGAGSRKSVAILPGVTETGKQDFLRPARQERELAEAERDVDLRLRQLKTGEPQARLAPDQLRQVIEQCRRLQEAHSRLQESRPTSSSSEPSSGQATDPAAMDPPATPSSCSSEIVPPLQARPRVGARGGQAGKARPGGGKPSPGLPSIRTSANSLGTGPSKPPLPGGRASASGSIGSPGASSPGAMHHRDVSATTRMAGATSSVPDHDTPASPAPSGVGRDGAKGAPRGAGSATRSSTGFGEGRGSVRDKPSHSKDSAG